MANHSRTRRAIILTGLPLLVGVLSLVGAGTALAEITSATIDGGTLGAGHQTITVTGTITCTEGDSWYGNGIQVIQGQKIVASGQLTAVGAACTGAPQPYSIQAPVADQKLLHPGRASVLAIFGSSTGGFSVDGFIKL
jgi:hypothetical protein